MFMLLITLLFSGFLANKASIHWALRWICYVSPFRWAWESLIVNEMAFIELNLVVSNLPPVSNYSGAAFLSDVLGVDPYWLTQDIIITACIYVINVLMAIGAMYLRVFLLRRGYLS